MGRRIAEFAVDSHGIYPASVYVWVPRSREMRGPALTGSRYNVATVSFSSTFCLSYIRLAAILERGVAFCGFFQRIEGTRAHGNQAAIGARRYV